MERAANRLALLGAGLILASLLAGCLAPAAAPTPAGPAPASRQSFSIPAPQWQPWNSWTYATPSVPGKNVTLELVAPYQVDEVAGLLGFIDRSPAQFVFVTQDVLGVRRMIVDGSVDDRCARMEAYRPFGTAPNTALDFPLHAGKVWLSRDATLVNEWRAVGLEQVRAGDLVLEAVRLEVSAWWESKSFPDAHRREGTDEQGARAHGPVAVLHYSPGVGAFVRMEWEREGLLSVPILPAEQPKFVPHKPGYQKAVVELVAHSLASGPPAGEAEILDRAAWGYCKSEAERKAWWANQDSLRSTRVAVEPASLEVVSPSPVAFNVTIDGPAPRTTVAWRIMAANGSVVREGTTQHPRLLLPPGRYQVVAEVAQDGIVFDSAYGTIHVGQDLEARVACSTASELTSGSVCEPLRFPLGAGPMRVFAEIQRGSREVPWPCARLELRDPAGNVAAHVEGNRDRLWLVTSLDLPALQEGWALYWMPKGAVASEAVIALDVTYGSRAFQHDAPSC